jgi:uncharacterized protein (TIGR03382 family)
MTPSNSRNFLIMSAGALACLFSIPAARAQLSYNTILTWDHISNSGYFGQATDDNAPTFGETFVAPALDTVLNDFTFYVGSTDGATDQTDNRNFLPDATTDSYTVQGEVFAWTGDLIAGDPTQGTTGAALFTSPTFTITPNGAFEEVTVSIPLGGLTLTAGDDYVIDLTDITASNPSDWGIFGVIPFSRAPNDGGGGFNFANVVGQDGTWDDFQDNGDLAFQADFTAPVSSSVPDAANTAIVFGLGLAGLAVLSRRRQRAAIVRA